MTGNRTPCIVGIGTTAFGGLYRNPDPERSEYDLALDAFYDALADAGLRKGEVDSLIVARLPSYLKFAADAGMQLFRYVNYQPAGGNQSGMALLQAVALIKSGQAEVVACVYGNTSRSAKYKYGGLPIPTSRYDDPYGMTGNGSYYGMQFRRHQLEFGTTAEALMEIAISNRANAALNPNAIMQTPITREDYFAAPMIVDPLRLFDHCLVNDGGVAYVVSTLERARDLKKRPVQVASSGVSAAMDYYYGTDDCWYAAVAHVRDRIFPAADLKPADIEIAQIYDNFTPAVLFTLEGMGICGRGEGGAWLTAGHHKRGGSLPINTAGGHLSEAYLQGWALTVEAVRQLRGEAGLRQVPGVKIALDATCSPMCSAHILVS